MYANILNTKAKRVWEPLAEKAPDKGCLRKGPAPCAREQWASTATGSCSGTLRRSPISGCIWTLYGWRRLQATS